MTRNILNQQDVTSSLAPILGSLDDCPADRAWLEKKARRWILRHFTPCGLVTRVSPARPDRIRVSWGQGRASLHQMTLPDWFWVDPTVPFHWLDLDGIQGKQLFQDLQLVADALRAQLPTLAPARRRRMDLPCIFALARQWSSLRRMEAQTLLRFDDGFCFVSLTSWEDYQQEGEAMNHCVGDYWRDNLDGTEILSLRTPDNKPCVTMEVGGGQDIWQIRGRGNSVVHCRYRPHVLQLIRELDLVPLFSAPWPGFMFRGFSPTDPGSWLYQPVDPDNTRAYRLFLIDLESAVDDLDLPVLRRSLTHLADSNGSLIQWKVVRHHDVYGLPLPVLRPRFPWRLHSILANARSQDRRHLARRLRSHFDDVLHRTLLAAPNALIDIEDSEELIRLDLRRHRHHHHGLLRERMAQHRRRRAGHLGEKPIWQDIWKRHHMTVLRMMDTAPARYL